VGVSFLFGPKASPLAHFSHRRLREYPVSGGPSTLRESIDDPLAKDYGERLLKALDWYGVAQVEFRYDPRDGLPKLMEINPRFWGSLPLAVFAGVDFPYLLFRLALGLPAEKAAPYALGKKCRWILPGDLLHFIKNPNRFHLNPSFFRFFDPDTAYDFLSARDPLPVFGRVLSLLNLIYDPDLKRLLRDRTDPIQN
jgi:predicted ATP-grasp superfamily ATP-dependent carboligase